MNRSLLNQLPLRLGMARIFLFVIYGNWVPAALHAQQAERVLLKDYQPVSIYKVPVTTVTRARFPVIDFHSHDYPKDAAELDQWVKTLESSNVEKTIILTYSTGKTFDSLVEKFSRYKDRFELWCGFDYTGFDQPDWEQRAVAELERCYRKGARGVGELGDKGLGELYSLPTPGYGVHIDNPRVKPLLQKCATLRMPVSIHVAEDQWMYEADNEKNDGLMNAAKWKVDMTKPGILTHDELVGTLAHAVRDNPQVTFIACHLANTCSDLSQLGRLFDQYPNLYADIAARYGEISPIPRYVKSFIEKYADRLVYGTDMGMSPSMYQVTFRILESSDEHFYDREQFGYHWPLHGLALSPATLEKLYHKNGQKILKR